MASDYEKQLEALMNSRCQRCGGSGEIDDAEPGDIWHNKWVCPACHGTGKKLPENYPK